MRQLIQILGEGNENLVKLVPVNRNHFFNWDGFFTKTLNYKRAIKDCSKYHCFYYDSTQMGKVYKSNTKIDTTTTKELINRNKAMEQWKISIIGLFPNIEKAPEIADIKKVELYTKWRKLIPDSYQDEMCPKPNDEIINKVKRDKAKKAKDKLIAKKTHGVNANNQSNN